MNENPAFELDELAEIYVRRGVDKPLARQVAEQLMAKDALTAHARDELGILEITSARPIQAALTSAAIFSVGAAMPLLMVIVSPSSALGTDCVRGHRWPFSPFWERSGQRRAAQTFLRATIRVTFWGAFALGAHRRHWKAVRDGGLKFRLRRLRACNLVWLRSGSRALV